MAFVPAPNIVEVEIRATLGGQQIENVIDVDALTAVTPAVVADITNAVSVWAQATYFDFLPAAVQLVEVVGTDLTTADGSQHSIAPESAVFGSIADPPMPNEVTLCISHRSGNRGRSARGRSYVLALPRIAVTGNLVSAGHAGDLAGAFNTLMANLTAEGWAFVVVSYRTNNAPRPGGPVYYPITSNIVTDLVVDSMRSRKPGVGA